MKVNNGSSSNCPLIICLTRPGLSVTKSLSGAVWTTARGTSSHVATGTMSYHDVHDVQATNCSANHGTCETTVVRSVTTGLR